MKKTDNPEELQSAQSEVKELINQEDDSFDKQVDASVKNENRKLYAFLFIVVFGIISILLLGCMLSIYNAAASVNKYFGYVVGVLLLAAFILLLGVPSIKIFFLPYYSVDKKGKPSAFNRAGNNRVVKRVAQNLVSSQGEGKTSYISPEMQASLAEALHSGTDLQLQGVLKDVYDTDVNKKVRSIILKNSCKAFCYTAISQNDKLDSISVLLINIRMIKSILYAYGTRPSMYKLVRIYFRVLISSLVAYGMQNVSVSNILSKFVKATASIVPALGMLIDSAVQGTTASILTLIVGYKTKAYVYGEYKLVMKDEFEYNKALYSDTALAQAIGEYNLSKGIMQERVQNARRSLDEGKKSKVELPTVVVNAETAPVASPDEVKLNEQRQRREKELADSDLQRLLGTAAKLSDNSKRKKKLKGIDKNEDLPPKRKGGWSIHRGKDKPTDVTAVNHGEEIAAADSDLTVDNSTVTELREIPADRLINEPEDEPQDNNPEVEGSKKRWFKRK